MARRKNDADMELEVSPGRSVGSVEMPDVHADLPPISDEDVNQAIAELGVVGLNVGQLRGMRRLGQYARESGVISVARGMVVAGFGQMMDISNRARELEKTYDDPESKDKFLRIGRDCAQGLVNAGKIILESEIKRTNSSDMPVGTDDLPKKPRLPEFGEKVEATQVAVAGDLHIHNNG